MTKYKYNPQNAPAEELLATFTARELMLDSILKEIKKQAKAKANQHYLYIGPRGVGKTNFLRMIYLNTKSNEEISKNWLSVQFAEEEYSITNLRELLEKILETLIEEIHDDSLSSFCKEVREEKDEIAQEKILETLKTYLKSINKKLIVLIDNLDLILSDQFKDDTGVKRLRDILMNDSFLMIIAASPTYFEEISSYDQPLYNFFKIKNLDELNENEIEELIIKRAEYEKNYELLKRLDQFKTKLKAIRHLTGGNPRLILMIYQLLSLSEFNEVKDYLNGLLDDLTPYYQYKMKWLSVQQRKIFESMAKLNGAVTPTEISKNSRLPVNVVTSNLRRLLDEGYIRTAEQARRKSTYYIISERLFRIWYQMRFSRKLRKRIELFVEFIQLWYSKEELETEIENLSQKFETYLTDKDMIKAKNIIEHLDYIAEASYEPKIKDKINDQVILMMINAGDFPSAEEKLSDKLSHCEYDTKELSYYLVLLGLISSVKGDFKRSLEFIDDAVKKDSENAMAWTLRGINLTSIENHNEALESYNKAIKLGSANEIAWEGKGDILRELKRFGEAIECYNMVIELKPDNYHVLGGKAKCLMNLRKYEEAVELYEKILEKNSADAEGWYNKGLSLYYLRKYNEALENYNTAIKIKPEYYRAILQKGIVLFKIGKNEKSLENLNRVLDLITLDVNLDINFLIATHLIIFLIKAIGKNFGDAKINFIKSLVYYKGHINKGAKKELLITIFQSILTPKNFLFISELLDEIKKFELNDEYQLLEPYRIAVEYFEKNRDQEILDRLNPEVRETVEEIIKKVEEKEIKNKE